MIQIGDSLPDTTLMEYVQTEGEGCSIGPRPVQVAQACAHVARQQCVEGHAGVFGPAVHRQLPPAGRVLARVQGDGDPLAAEFGQPRRDGSGFAHGQ